MTETVAIVEKPIVEDDAPIVAVSYLEPIGPWDSGLALWSSPAEQTGETVPVHLSCLRDDYPWLDWALDYAKEHGEWNAP